MSFQRASIKLTVRFDRKIKAWVLVSGGWFPLQLASFDILIVDRNIVSALLALEVDPSRNDLAPDKWWLEHLNKPSMVLNPILCAGEGRWRSLPTYEQFVAELDGSCDVLERTLPRARIVRHPREHLKAIYEIRVSQAPKMLAEIEFLTLICPRLADRVPSGNEEPLESLILFHADRLGLSRFSLCVVATLSVLYERPDGAQPRIGRGVLKPKRHYSEGDAYNALSDMSALEFLAAGSVLLNGSCGFCTRDKYLAAFWIALGFHSGELNDASFSTSFTPKVGLFPRLKEGQVNALFERLKPP